jgi:uncharacterized protein (TIGR03435 family)
MKTGTTVLFLVLSGFAQTAQQPPAFEAATIKIDTASTSETGAFEHGRLIINWATLRHLVGAAYDTPVYRVEGGPKWVDTTRFDVSAKADEKASEAASRLMLRTLLAERFHLRLHNEDRSESVYVLRVGPRGSKLQESTANSTGRGCAGSAPMTCHKVTMATLAGALRANGTGIDLPVLDETGLKGNYDFTLAFAAGAAENASGPSIFDALQEQLGLNLQASKRPINVLVIDDAQALSGEN